MQNLTTVLPADSDAQHTVTLPFDTRQKSRFRAQLDSGEEIGVILPRGTVLREGDCLGNENGELQVRVRAADEAVSTVRVDDGLLLARAAYHLGNRHVPLQITANYLRYQHDHVLDDMLKQMGLDVVCEQAPFEPEAGAYSGGHGHHHSHDHDHAHA